MARKIRVGEVPSSGDGGNGTGFWNLKEGQTVELTLLASMDEIVSVDQFALWDLNPAPIWASIGADDPGYELNLKPGYKAFVPVAFEGDDGPEVKLWAIGIGLHKELAELAEVYDDIKNIVVRAKRVGSGLTTKYSVIALPKGKPIGGVTAPTVDEVIAQLGPETRDDVISFIVERTSMSWESIISYYERKASKTAEDGMKEESF